MLDYSLLCLFGTRLQRFVLKTILPQITYACNAWLIFLPLNFSLLSISPLLLPPSVGTISNTADLTSKMRASLWNVQAGLWVWSLHMNGVGYRLHSVPAFLSRHCFGAQSMERYEPLIQCFFLRHHVHCTLQLPGWTCNIPVAVNPEPVPCTLPSEWCHNKHSCAHPLRHPVKASLALLGQRAHALNAVQLPPEWLCLFILQPAVPESSSTHPHWHFVSSTFSVSPLCWMYSGISLLLWFVFLWLSSDTCWPCGHDPLLRTASASPSPVFYGATCLSLTDWLGLSYIQNSNPLAVVGITDVSSLSALC